jgi:hypothetical protein
MVEDGKCVNSNMVLKSSTEMLPLAEGGLSLDVGLAVDVGALLKKINTTSSEVSHLATNQDTDADKPGFLSKMQKKKYIFTKRKSGSGSDPSKSNSEIQENAKGLKKIKTNLEPPKFYEGCEYRCKTCGELRGSVEHIRNHIRKSHKVSQCPQVMYEVLAIAFALSLSVI